MYYGRGAGKLPTASAVVGDIVEGARFLGKNIGCCNWDAEDAVLESKDNLSQKYFVRVDGLDKAAVEAAFGKVSYVEAEGVTGETAFVTEEMTEKAYADAAAKVAVKSMIRI